MAPDVVLLTTSEVADLFRIDVSTVRRWADSGKLRSVGIGREKRFRREDIEAILRGETPVSGAA